MDLGGLPRVSGAGQELRGRGRPYVCSEMGLGGLPG